MSALTPERLASAAASVILAAALAWWFLSRAVVDPRQEPVFSAPALVRDQAPLPVIGLVESFNVNPEDPFLPGKMRADKKRLQSEARTRTGKPQPPKPPPKLVPDPPKTLPVIAARPGDLPLASGLIAGPSGPLVVVRPREGGSERILAPGESVGVWTLAGVEQGITVVWRDAQGQEMRVPVGEGLVAPASERPEPAPERPVPRLLVPEASGPDNGGRPPAPPARSPRRTPETH